ncbi:lactonase family protein [Verrucomicrobiaceae bacterium N1E253]|uniref:Lactonase family protein n=1 Tax=Oceaniferula marina TaxID=2748318 RepID=A0A851GED4_9BACT|nr:lactonase family protein [Oceaniferula marina]NWK55529.1 lactonase family protein [Oceaniferula marina]
MLKRLHYFICSTLLLSAQLTLAQETTTRVYIASGQDGIYSCELNQSEGTLTPPILRSKLTGAGFLAWHPRQNRLYATATLDPAKKKQGQSGGVIAFAPQADGSLTELNRQSTMGRGLCHISTDTSGNMLMGADYGGGRVVSFQMQSDGQLGRLTSIHQHKGSGSHPKRQTRAHAHSIYPGPENRYAYAADLGIDQVIHYEMTPKAGTLKRIADTKLPSGSGPRHMKFGKNGNMLYVLNELNTSVSVFKRIKATGKLEARQSLSMFADGTDNTDMTSSEIQISPDGRFLYCATRDLSQQQRDAISVFEVQKDGLLKRIQTIHPGVWFPRHIQLAPSGTFLLVAGQRGNEVSIMKIDQGKGTLKEAHQRIPLPTPMCISFQP